MTTREQRAANRERRRLALVAGEKLYWPVTPCRHGHLSARYSADGSCHQCKANRRTGAKHE